MTDALSPEVEQLVALLALQWDSSSQPVFAHGRGLQRIYSNPAFDALVGYSGADLIGRPPPHPYWAPDAFDQLTRACDALLEGRLQAIGVRSLIGRFRSAAGRTFEVLLAGGEIVDARGDEIAMVVFVFDLEQAGVEDPPISDLDAALRVLRRQAAESDALGPSETAAVLAGWEDLTQRQQEIARALGRGARIATIAKDLGISAHTVRNHVKAVFRKTGVRSQEELTLRLRNALATLGRTGRCDGPA